MTLPTDLTINGESYILVELFEDYYDIIDKVRSDANMGIKSALLCVHSKEKNVVGYYVYPQASHYQGDL